MANPVNPDGTVQVAPPQISAFSQQASAGAPPPPAAAPAQPQTAGFAAALMEMIQHLYAALKPGAHSAPARTEAAINAADPAPAPDSLGSQFGQK